MQLESVNDTWTQKETSAPEKVYQECGKKWIDRYFEILQKHFGTNIEKHDDVARHHGYLDGIHIYPKERDKMINYFYPSIVLTGGIIDGATHLAFKLHYGFSGRNPPYGDSIAIDQIINPENYDDKGMEAWLQQLLTKHLPIINNIFYKSEQTGKVEDYSDGWKIINFLNVCNFINKEPNNLYLKIKKETQQSVITNKWELWMMDPRVGDEKKHYRPDMLLCEDTIGSTSRTPLATQVFRRWSEVVQMWEEQSRTDNDNYVVNGIEKWRQFPAITAEFIKELYISVSNEPFHSVYAYTIPAGETYDHQSLDATNMQIAVNYMMHSATLIKPSTAPIDHGYNPQLLIVSSLSSGHTAAYYRIHEMAEWHKREFKQLKNLLQQESIWHLQYTTLHEVDNVIMAMSSGIRFADRELNVLVNNHITNNLAGRIIQYIKSTYRCIIEWNNDSRKYRIPMYGLDFSISHTGNYGSFIFYYHPAFANNDKRIIYDVKRRDKVFGITCHTEQEVIDVVDKLIKDMQRWYQMDDIIYSHLEKEGGRYNEYNHIAITTSLNSLGWQISYVYGNSNVTNTAKTWFVMFSQVESVAKLIKLIRDEFVTSPATYPKCDEVITRLDKVINSLDKPGTHESLAIGTGYEIDNKWLNWGPNIPF